MKVIIVKSDSSQLEVNDNFEHSLENLQKVVGGYIEAVTLRVDNEGRSLTMFLNEEGKLENLPPNIAMIRETDNELLDIVVGDVIFTSSDNQGETVSLNEDEIAFIKEKLDFNSVMFWDDLVIEKILKI